LSVNLQFPKPPVGQEDQEELYLEVGQAVGATYYASYKKDTMNAAMLGQAYLQSLLAFLALPISQIRFEPIARSSQVPVKPGKIRAVLRKVISKFNLSPKYGGIDFNQISVNHTGKMVNVQFDPLELDELMQGGFEGFNPVITKIIAISSPFQLLEANKV